MGRVMEAMKILVHGTKENDHTEKVIAKKGNNHAGESAAAKKGGNNAPSCFKEVNNPLPTKQVVKNNSLKKDVKYRQFGYPVARLYRTSPKTGREGTYRIGLNKQIVTVLQEMGIGFLTPNMKDNLFYLNPAPDCLDFDYSNKKYTKKLSITTKNSNSSIISNGQIAVTNYVRDKNLSSLFDGYYPATILVNGAIQINLSRKLGE